MESAAGTPLDLDKAVSAGLDQSSGKGVLLCPEASNGWLSITEQLEKTDLAEEALCIVTPIGV
jgi:hypothetical protein